MRILQLVQTPQRRGAEIFAYQLSERFINDGHDVKTVYLYPSSAARNLPLRNGDVIIGKKENHFSEAIPGWNIAILKKLAATIRSFQPDIVQVNAGRTVKYGALLRYLTRGKWRLIYRNIGDPSVWLATAWHRWIYRVLLMPKIDGIVAVSSHSLSVLKDFYGEQAPMINIPRAVDAKLFVPKIDRETVREKLNTPADARLMIFVGSLTFEKRIERLLKVLEINRPKIPQLYLWIVGEGPLREKLERDASTLGVADSVRFIGAQEDVASFVNAADLLVLSSDTEGIPGVVLEAALLEVPSVACASGGTPDCIVQGETGILVESKDENQFAAEVSELIMQPQKRNEMGKRAKEWVQSKFAMEAVSAEYLRFYRHVLDANRNGKSN